MSRSGYQTSQNVDNFLSAKPSTRQHMPPGGGSTAGALIYGGGDGESPFAGRERHTMRRKTEAPEQAPNPYSKDHRRANVGDNYNQPPVPQQHVPSQAQQHAGGQQRAGASSNQYASGSNQNSGNVLTDRRITRIHAPPGGVSSIRFG